jgi:nucleoside-diphosphate-sugar epimerase
MKVLVTGATGFIGKHLVSRLRKGGSKISCLVRKSSNPKDIEFLANHKVRLFYGDITDKESLVGITDKVDVVYHLAGILGRFGVPDESYFKAHVEGTRNLLGLCDKQKFVQCSSAGVLGPVTKGNEDSRYNPTNAYEKSKAEAEKLVREYHDHVIIRPEFVYGPFDTHALPFFRAIKENRFYFMGDGKSYLHPTYVDDMVQILQKCLKERNEIFVVAGERAVTVKEFACKAAELMGVDFNEKHIPLGMARMARPFSEAMGKTLGKEPPLTKSRMDFFTKSRTFDTGKAKARLGYKPIELRKGLQITLEWYKQNGLL